MMFRFCGQGRTAECGTFGFNAYQDKYDSGCEGANPAIAL
jgi:hypothetical protein